MKLKKLLVFRLSSLGDVAMTIPVIVAVLEQNPNIAIDFIAPKFMHSLFPFHNRLNLIEFDKKQNHKGLLGIYRFFKKLNSHEYHAFVDLHQVLRSYVLKYLFKLKGIPTFTIHKGRQEKKNLIQKKTLQPLKHTTERYADVFRKMGLEVKINHTLQNFHPVQKMENTKAIGIAPFAAHPGKMYDLDAMEMVVKNIHQPVYVFGSSQELSEISHWKELDHVKLVEGKSLREELKLISKLKVMVSMDSANMHLASLVGTPVISIWGVTHPSAGFLGYGQSLKNVIQDESLSWRPTSIFGNQLGPNDNPNGMKNIFPEIILKKISEFI